MVCVAGGWKGEEGGRKCSGGDGAGGGGGEEGGGRRVAVGGGDGGRSCYDLCQSGVRSGRKEESVGVEVDVV